MKTMRDIFDSIKKPEPKNKNKYKYTCIECNKTTQYWIADNWVKLEIRLVRSSYYRSIRKNVYWCPDCGEDINIMPYHNNRDSEDKRNEILNRTLTIMKHYLMYRK